jgi:hypothetical protein
MVKDDKVVVTCEFCSSVTSSRRTRRGWGSRAGPPKTQSRDCRLMRQPQFNTRLLSGLSSENAGTSISNFSPLSLTIW